MQKTLLAVVPLVLLSFFSQAQSIERFVIGSTGNYKLTGNYSLSSTVGEAIITTATGGSNILTQGFQQPNDKSTGIAQTLAADIKTIIYPNPSAEWVNLEITADKAQEYQLELTDMLGRRLDVYTTLQIQGGTSTYRVNLHGLAAAIYLLHLTSTGNHIDHTFKVSKINY